MTREEAIKILNTVLAFGKCDCPKEEIEQCLIMAIKALEQEFAFDKIKEDIKALPNANPSYHGYIDVVERDEVFEIIDKYRK